jgi:hypothetical protein
MQGKKMTRKIVTQIAKNAWGRIQTIEITKTTRPREG